MLLPWRFRLLRRLTVILKCFVFICVILWSSLAEAVRWDFDGETTQGWAAKKDVSSGGRHEFHRLSGVVADGVWSIEAFRSDDHNPSVEVISPTIGYESGLFDRMRIRFRTVHHSPTLGFFNFKWTNEHNLTLPGHDPEFPTKRRFLIPGPRDFVFTTEWQEVEISIADQDELLWAGALRDIRLSFYLDQGQIDVSRPAEAKVGRLEIDWVELTGVEETLQGELSPPQAEYFHFEGAGRFAPPVFYPIVSGLGGSFVSGDRNAGVLADLDGDGDLDLFAAWRHFPPKESATAGWVMAFNDGTGTLEPVLTEETRRAYLNVQVGDLTGDGTDEIVLAIDGKPAVWSMGPNLQIEVLAQMRDRYMVGLADWDGDGDVELFATDDSYLEVWDVSGGVWTASQLAALPEDHLPFQVGDLTGDGELDMLWGPIFGRASTWLMSQLRGEFTGGSLSAFEPARSFDLDSSTFLRVGDFDGDGQVDLLTALRYDGPEHRKGLVVWHRGVGDNIEGEVLYDGRLFLRSSVVVRDLDANGVEDWTFVSGDRASGFGVFVEWGGGANPAKEVERHRLDGDGVQVLAGDMDSDGDLDLVVLDPILGGVHVLKSSVGEQRTAVMTPAAARPAQHRLGDSYPNPFNPAVVLPLALATDAAEVSLTVYDVLGRRVRQLWQGPLGAGSHRFVWDGRDEEGKAVAAGVYIYQVEVDGQVEAKKTTKLP